MASLLSLGSGNPGVITLPSDGGELDIYRAIRDVMNDCTEIAREMKLKIGRSGIYFRFSVEQGMQNDYPSQAMDPGWIVAQTESYLEENTDQLEAFTKDKNIPTNIVTLGQLSMLSITIECYPILIAGFQSTATSVLHPESHI